MRVSAIAVLFLILYAPLVDAAAVQTGPFVVDTVLEGVWLFRVPANSAEYTNSLVVERDTGLLVVESQPSPRAANELIGAIGRVSPKPIRYLVLSHAHVESTGGASAFPESTLIIASPFTAQALADESTDLGADIRLRSPDPDAWVAPPRVEPQMLIGGDTVLTDGALRVSMHTVQLGHYPGTLVVRIDEPDVVFIGALATNDRNPYADPEQSSPREWVMWTNSLLFGGAKTIVPLRGEPFDVDALRDQRDALAWALGQVEYGIVERMTFDEIMESTTGSAEFSKHFDVAAKPFFGRGFIQRALELRGKKR